MKNNNEKKYELTRGSNGIGFFDSIFNDIFDFPFTTKREVINFMKTDVSETENNFKLEIDLPGFDKKDIKLNLENGYLTVSAKKFESDDEKDKKGNYIRRERYYGSSTRTFYVGDIEEKDIDAKLDKGILSISLPKENRKREQKKYIEIK